VKRNPACQEGRTCALR